MSIQEMMNRVRANDATDRQMSVAIKPLSDSLAARIRLQATRCRICEAPDEREVLPAFDPDDLDAGVFLSCVVCYDNYSLEKA